LVNKLNLEPGEQYFKHPNGRKIYALYDVPHLFKSIRNNLISKDFFVKLNGVDVEQVSWRDVRDAFVIDQGAKLARGNVKLSSRHIAPNKFDRMSVKLAVQALSWSTAALINTVIGTGQLKSRTAPSTAKFITMLNHLFAALNSSAVRVDNPYNCYISKKNAIARKTLTDAPEFIGSWVVMKRSTRDRLFPPCFTGLQNTIRAILDLWNDLESEGYYFLLTSRLNQDPIECLFSMIRARGGFDRNPTTRQLMMRLRLGATHGLIRDGVHHF
jgi:hypothetical protein